MDERNNKSDNNDSNGGSPGIGGIAGTGRNGGLGRARPSGSSGSKISSRASEHSIAKLMETLVATAGTNLSSGKSKGKAFQDECINILQNDFSLANLTV